MSIKETVSLKKLQFFQGYLWLEKKYCRSGENNTNYHNIWNRGLCLLQRKHSANCSEQGQRVEDGIQPWLGKFISPDSCCQIASLIALKDNYTLAKTKAMC